jgi:hypothetical protein
MPLLKNWNWPTKNAEENTVCKWCIPNSKVALEVGDRKIPVFNPPSHDVMAHVAY